MEYLLDTSICVGLMARDLKIRTHLSGIDERSIALSSITLYELWYGIEKSNRYEQSVDRLTAFQQWFPAVLNWSVEDARTSARIRRELERQKQTIGPYDTLIAGQALARGLILVTANEREFRRVKGLRWQNWTKE